MLRDVLRSKPIRSVFGVPPSPRSPGAAREPDRNHESGKILIGGANAKETLTRCGQERATRIRAHQGQCDEVRTIRQAREGGCRSDRNEAPQAGRPQERPLVSENDRATHTLIRIRLSGSEAWLPGMACVSLRLAGQRQVARRTQAAGQKEDSSTCCPPCGGYLASVAATEASAPSLILSCNSFCAPFWFITRKPRRRPWRQAGTQSLRLTGSTAKARPFSVGTSHPECTSSISSSAIRALRT